MISVTIIPAKIPRNGVNCRGTGDSENISNVSFIIRSVFTFPRMIGLFMFATYRLEVEQL